MTVLQVDKWRQSPQSVAHFIAQAFAWSDRVLSAENIRRKIWECPNEPFYRASEILSLHRRQSQPKIRQTIDSSSERNSIKYCACYMHFKPFVELGGLLQNELKIETGSNHHEIELHICVYSVNTAPKDLYAFENFGHAGWNIFGEFFSHHTTSEFALCFLAIKNVTSTVNQHRSVLVSQFRAQKELARLLSKHLSNNSEEKIKTNIVSRVHPSYSSFTDKLQSSDKLLANTLFSSTKVGFYVASFATFGGLEQWVVNMVRSLQEIGVDCAVIVFHDAAPNSSFPKSLLSVTHFLSGSTQRLSKIIQEQNIDVLLVNHVYSGLQTLHRDVIQIEIIHNIYFWQKGDVNISSVRTEFECIICISEATAEYTANYLGVAENKIRIIQHGLDLFGFIRPLKGTGPASVPDGVFRFLSVANQYPQKNGLLLIKAFCEEFANDETVYLELAGAPSHVEIASAMQRFAQQSPCAHRVKFHGTINRHDLSRIYSKASVFCLPSLYEGFGLATLEAMHFGIPLILSNTGHASALTRNGNGIVVDLAVPLADLSEQIATKTAMEPSEKSIKLLRTSFRKMKDEHEFYSKPAKTLAHGGKIKTVSSVAVEYAKMIASARQIRKGGKQ